MGCKSCTSAKNKRTKRIKNNESEEEKYIEKKIKARLFFRKKEGSPQLEESENPKKKSASPKCEEKLNENRCTPPPTQLPRVPIVQKLLKKMDSEEKKIKATFDKINCSQSSINEWIDRIKTLESKKYLKDYAHSKDRAALGSQENLLKFLKDSPGRNEIEKLWVIYLWVTKNISYDINYLKDKSSTNLGDPFITGKAVCGGFSDIVEIMCDAVGIKCKKVSGYARAFGYKLGESFQGKSSNHAWNIVLIEGKWRFIECTWGEGYGTKDYEAVKRFDPYWFLVPPEIFIYKHFPLGNQENQLLETPLTLDEFENLPLLRLEFFRLGFKMVKEQNMTIKTEANPFFIKIETTKNSKLLVALKTKDSSKEIENAVFTQIKDQIYEVSIAAPKGIYELNLFGKGDLDDKDKKYNSIGDFIIESNSNQHMDLKWCKTYSQKAPSYLYMPKEKILEFGKIVYFKIWTKGVDVVLISPKKNWFFFKKTKESRVWELEKEVQERGEYSILIKSSFSERSYFTAFTYSTN